MNKLYIGAMIRQNRLKMKMILQTGWIFNDILYILLFVCEMNMNMNKWVDKWMMDKSDCSWASFMGFNAFATWIDNSNNVNGFSFNNIFPTFSASSK